MTVEQQVDALATSVDELKGTVVTKKATLDASVVDAQSATTQAQAAKTNALSARDQSGSFKDAAYTAAQSAASAVAYQDLTALAAEKVVTAVDVFIYDTSKDSDGGAWRNRCAGTSWFNEPLNTATRGGRREFPAVAVIVAEADKVTIYDGDDPALPMWMVFLDDVGVFNTPYGIAASIFARNATFVAGGYKHGPVQVSFVSDRVFGWNPHSGKLKGNFLGGIALRNSASVSYDNSANGFVINDIVNDVAMTVLPNAPIGQATGLPVPTIAVATEGGVSVIKDDGAVVDITENAGRVRLVAFDELGRLFVHDSHHSVSGYGAVVQFNAVPESDVVTSLNGHPGGDVIYDYTGGGWNLPRSKNKNAIGFTSMNAGNGFLSLGSYRTGAAALHYGSSGEGVARFYASDHSAYCGIQDMVGVFLTETDDTDLTATVELNNDVDMLDSTLWNYPADGVDWSVSGQVTVTEQQGSDRSVSRNLPGVETGKYYRVEIEYTDATTGSSGNRIQFSGFSYYVLQATTTPVTKVFYAKAGAYNNIGILLSSTNATTTILRMSVKEVDFNRVLNPAGAGGGPAGLIVNGTVTREPVATGAELIAYSGFSEANYLEGTGASYVDTLYALGWEQTNGVWGFKHGVVSAAPIDGVSITGTTLKIAGTKPKALIRLTATVPTADQLAKIEADERVLFQENAACTLYGASDAVTALAHDPDTDLLHVGTSAGRSVFKGLRRLANTTVPVGAAIAAAGGMVVEE